MAKLEYDETGRLLFTQEMRKEYTILIPQMLPIHFGFFAKLLARSGYNVAILNNDGKAVVDSGLKYVHNDACYPALLVIGQMIDAIQNGGYDPHKVALLITQTGGGCRASNYIHMLRKALEKAGLDYIPVISLSFGLEKNPGFHWTVGLIRRLIYGMMYGDLIMNVANQVRPYEVNPGDTAAHVDHWTTELLDRFDKGDGMSRKKMRGIFDEICADFKSIPVSGEEKIRVGVVGEILVKYMPLANNHLVDLLEAEGAEAVVPDLIDFLNYCVYNGDYKHEFLGAGWTSAATAKLGVDAIRLIRKPALDALEKSRRFEPPMPIEKVAELAKPFLSIGNQYGEGWFLTGEMAELVLSGTPNIVCIQPFACLPNHVVGKGVIKALKKAYPQSNIVAVDYDPGASEVNQLNRIKLMLSTAKKRLAEEEAAAV